VAVDEAAPDSLEMKLMAVIESIAFLVRANVDAMHRLAGAPQRVVVSGGLARADVLTGRLAALLDGELLRLRPAEATTLGLWCRMRGGGLEPDAFEPVTPAPAEGLADRYRRWLDAMPPIEDPPIPRAGA
jgi:sugar (pentulose or hexulose) kinase